jgi:hypothetical protein
LLQDKLIYPGDNFLALLPFITDGKKLLPIDFASLVSPVVGISDKIYDPLLRTLPVFSLIVKTLDAIE